MFMINNKYFILFTKCLLCMIKVLSINKKKLKSVNLSKVSMALHIFIFFNQFVFIIIIICGG